jgi:hypothetical protein
MDLKRRSVTTILRASRSSVEPVRPNASIAERWAQLVLRVCECDCDPRTVHDWARSVGVSQTSLCETCRMLHIKPRHARDFARMLRVIIRAHQLGHPIEALLTVGDARTLKSLIRRSGIGPTLNNDPEQLSRFIESQQFVSSDNPGLVEVSRLLAHQD